MTPRAHWVLPTLPLSLAIRAVIRVFSCLFQSQAICLSPMVNINSKSGFEIVALGTTLMILSVTERRDCRVSAVVAIATSCE
jgi:hypothetical protein